jgi:hypothetical protein
MEPRRSSLRYGYSRLLPVVMGVLLGVVLFPSPALAFIQHWDPKEAFFTRQFSYLFFMVAMIFFIYELKQERLQQHRGFRLLAWASVFFALWNFDCFIGQFIAMYFKGQVIGGAPGSFSQRLLMADVGNWIYYFTKLDHLLLVPAFIYFYRGITAFSREVEEGAR